MSSLGMLDSPDSPAKYGEDTEQRPFNAYSTQYGKALVVSKGPGKLFGFSVFNSLGATQYVLLFDTDTFPPTGAVGLVCAFPVTTLSTLLVGYGDTGRSFNSGIYLANSSTPNTLTAGASDCWFDAQYI